MKNPEVSIIIRTYNEEKDIGKCLNKIFSQAYKSFEVIIVDSESEDKTIEIAKRFPLKIINIRKEDFTFGKSLNLGCSEAKGKYCLSLSAHAFPVDNFWLNSLIEPLKNKQIAGVYGKEVPRQDCNPLEARKILGTFNDKEKIQTKDCFFSNVNSAFKKDLWEKVKFNEEISSTEDHFWAKQIIEQGYLIYYQPRAKVYHSHNYSLASLYKRIKRNVYNKYKKIENKNPLFICYKGFNNFFYSIFADWKFILKRKESFYWMFATIPYNTITLIAYISAAFKKSLLMPFLIILPLSSKITLLQYFLIIHNS